MNFKSQNTLLSKIAAWSDAHLAEARGFVLSRQGLLQYDLSISQLYALANIIRSSQEYPQITDFIKNQAGKAERAGKSKTASYWQDLKTKFDDYAKDAQEIARITIPRQASDVEQVKTIHRQLQQCFVQHLIAESLLYQRRINEQTKGQ